MLKKISSLFNIFSEKVAGYRALRELFPQGINKQYLDIELVGGWGDQEKKVRLAFVKGGAGVIQVYVDDWYHGQAVIIGSGHTLFLCP